MSDRIEVNPRVCNGNPVIRGTRIPVAVILDHLAVAVHFLRAKFSILYCRS